MKTGLGYLCFIVIALLAKASTAQVGNCDSLQVLDFQLNPFNTEQLVLRSAYSDFDNFISYPGFSMVDENLYILAQEEVNFFGMSTEQVHSLDVYNLEVTEGEAIFGDLELWSFFYENLECVLTGPYVLWPVHECVPLRITVNLYDADSAGGHLSWSISQEGGEHMAGQSIMLDTMPELFHFDFCLPPGCGYTLNIETTEMEGAGMAYSLHYSNFLAVGAFGSFAGAESQNHSFDIYNCLNTGGDETESPSYALYPNPVSDLVFVEFEKAELPQFVLVTDLTGREVARIQDPKDHRVSINCSQWPPGVYLISVVQRNNQLTTKKLVITR